MNTLRMRVKLFFIVILAWVNGLSNSVNAANETEIVAVVLPDGSKVTSLGNWYVYALQGDDNSHGKIGCFDITVFKNGKGDAFCEYVYTFDGKPVDFKLQLKWTDHPIKEFFLYQLNDDGSKNGNVCNFERGKFTSHRHFYKFNVIQSPCVINPGLNFTAFCVSKSDKLNPGDIEDMYEFCPPENSVYIDRENC